MEGWGDRRELEDRCLACYRERGEVSSCVPHWAAAAIATDLRYEDLDSFTLDPDGECLHQG